MDLRGRIRLESVIMAFPYAARYRFLALVAASIFFAHSASADIAGSVFVTGHDPDFHAFLGGNALGAQHIIQDALTFVRNGNTNPVLLIESNLNNEALGDHTDSEQGL